MSYCLGVYTTIFQCLIRELSALQARLTAPHPEVFSHKEKEQLQVAEFLLKLMIKEITKHMNNCLK